MQGQKIRIIQIRNKEKLKKKKFKKKEKLFIFADDMIAYIGNPNYRIYAPPPNLQLTREFRKLTGYESNTQLSIILLHTNNKNQHLEDNTT